MRELRIDMLLPIQRALWEQVTPDLRGVAASCTGSDGEGKITARFLYEGDIGAVAGECVSLAETHCIADFPPSVTVRFHAVPHASRELQPGADSVRCRHPEMPHWGKPSTGASTTSLAPGLPTQPRHEGAIMLVRPCRDLVRSSRARVVRWCRSELGESGYDVFAE
jgi:hypothetical protein